MFTARQITIALIKVHIKRINGLKNFTRGARSMKDYQDLITEYCEEHSKFSNILNNSGISDMKLINMIKDAK